MLFHSKTIWFSYSLYACTVWSPHFSHVHICWQLLSFQTAVSGCVLTRTETKAEVRKKL